MTRTGTNHFTSQAKAARYYADYGYTPQEVLGMIQRKEILIGEPTIEPHQRLVTVDRGARYAIEE